MPRSMTQVAILGYFFFESCILIENPRNIIIFFTCDIMCLCYLGYGLGLLLRYRGTFSSETCSE